MSKRKKKPVPADIIDWLSTCVGEVEADGYQQSEQSMDRWYVSGPPVINGIDAASFFVDFENETFIVKVKRLVKPHGEIRLK